MSEKTVSRKTVSDKTPSDKTLSEKIAGDKTASEPVVSEQVTTKQIAGFVDLISRLVNAFKADGASTVEAWALAQSVVRASQYNALHDQTSIGWNAKRMMRRQNCGYIDSLIAQSWGTKLLNSTLVLEPSRAKAPTARAA